MYEQLFILTANVFKALGHSRRLEIIQLLGKNELPVTDIYQMLDLPQANVSQHLMVLRDENILECRKTGKQIYYKVADVRLLGVIDSVRKQIVETSREKIGDVDLLKKIHDLVPLVHDPVCKMRVSPKTAGFVCEHKGMQYYFCASGCLKQFKKDPEKYAS